MPPDLQNFLFQPFLPSLDTQHCAYLILLHQYIYTYKFRDYYSVAITAIHHGQKRVHVCHSKHAKRTVVVPPPIPSRRPLLCVSKMTLHHFSCQSQGTRHPTRSKARPHSRMRPRTTVRSFSWECVIIWKTGDSAFGNGAWPPTVKSTVSRTKCSPSKTLPISGSHGRVSAALIERMALLLASESQCFPGM